MVGQRGIVKGILLAGVVAGSVFFMPAAQAGISGSAHDFSGKIWNTTGEVCVVCHTPHNAVASSAPLWNHKMSTATFTVYSSPTLKATVGQPSASSLACLSCHDGTVALDSFGGRTGTQFIQGDAKLGTDLNNDHPISFLYDTALAHNKKNMADPSTTTSGLGSTIQNDLLFTNKMECASCHDVHNGTNVAKLLVKSNAGSQLCLTCHAK